MRIGRVKRESAAAAKRNRAADVYVRAVHVLFYCDFAGHRPAVDIRKLKSVEVIQATHDAEFVNRKRKQPETAAAFKRNVVDCFVVHIIARSPPRRWLIAARFRLAHDEVFEFEGLSDEVGIVINHDFAVHRADGNQILIIEVANGEFNSAFHHGEFRRTADFEVCGYGAAYGQTRFGQYARNVVQLEVFRAKTQVETLRRRRFVRSASARRRSSEPGRQIP